MTKQTKDILSEHICQADIFGIIFCSGFDFFLIFPTIFIPCPQNSVEDFAVWEWSFWEDITM